MDCKVLDVKGSKVVFIPNDFSIVEVRDEENLQNVVPLLERYSKDSRITDIPDVEMLELDFCVTRKCNLRCTYCYANQTSNDMGEMSYDVARRAVDYFYEKFGKVRWKIDFIGQGEPLIQIELIAKVIDYIKSKKSDKEVSFFVITNGTLLTKEKYKLLTDRSVSIGISVDGSEKNHNLNRRFIDGKGSYKCIQTNLSEIGIGNAKGNVWALSVATGENNLVDIVRSNKSMGFKRFQVKIARISGDNNADRRKMYAELSEQYKDFFGGLKDDLMNNDLEVFYSIVNETDTVGKIMRALLRGQKNFRRCKAGFGRFSIATNGDIYPCSSYYSMSMFRLGNVYENNMNTEMCAQFALTNVDNDVDCKKCWCRYMCGGVCKYSASAQYSDLNRKNEFDCRLTEVICEEVIKLVYELKKENEPILRKMIRFSELN